MTTGIGDGTHELQPLRLLQESPHGRERFCHRRESGYERTSRVTDVLTPHPRPVLRVGADNVLSISQNLRRGWTTDPGPLSFGPTPPLLADAKITSDQRINEGWRRASPLNRRAVSLILRRIADASFVYPQIHPRMTAINGKRSQLGWEKGSTFSGTFPDLLCATGLDQCRRTNGFGSRLEQASP